MYRLKKKKQLQYKVNLLWSHASFHILIKMYSPKNYDSIELTMHDEANSSVTE